jgi:hypothetical protein
MFVEGVFRSAARPREKPMMNHCLLSNPQAPGRLFSFLVAACLALPVFAADGADRSELLTNPVIRELPPGDDKPDAIEWFGSVGATYIDAEDGSKLWLTPFTLDAQLSRDTTLRVEGDGFGHIDFDGSTTQGFSNVTLIASQVVFRNEASRVRLAIGASAPGSNGTGSSGAKQRVSASYSRNLSPSWSLLAAGRLTRRNQDPLPGASRIEQYGRLQAGYTLDPPIATSLLPRAVTVLLERTYRHGAGGTTQATASYEFPLSAKLGGAISFTRGLSTGLRDNTLAFDLLFGF